MSEKYYVVAGNHDQYKTFVHRKVTEMWEDGACPSMSDFVYVGPDGDNLRGISNPHGWFYGTWRERKDIKNIVTVLKVCTNNNNDALNKIYWDVCK
jgi:hypothetical protein